MGRPGPKPAARHTGPGRREHLSQAALRARMVKAPSPQAWRPRRVSGQLGRKAEGGREEGNSHIREPGPGREGCGHKRRGDRELAFVGALAF